MSKRIVIFDPEDVKVLVAIAGKCKFPVQVNTGSNYRNASSMLGMFTIDFSKPFEIQYDGENEDLETFVANHEA